jgi:hypothetical protein
MAVNAVEADVELAAEIPRRVREFPFIELLERLEPRDPLAPFVLPKLLEVAVIDARVGIRLTGELLRRLVAALLQEQRVDCRTGLGLSRIYLHLLSERMPDGQDLGG